MFENITLSLTAPITINVSVTLSQLSLMSGHNGVGKSFINKLLWSANFFQAMMITEKITNPTQENKQAHDTKILQGIFDATFTDQNFNGDIKLYGKDQELVFTIQDGTILSLFYNTTLKPVGMPIYLSAQVRSFDAIEKYLTIKNLMDIEIQTLDDALKLKDVYRLYDVFAYEKLIANMANFNKIANNPIAGELLKEIDTVELTVEGKDIFAIDSKAVKTKASILGAGDQAILIILLTTL